jgi:imidazolonepropionase
MNTSFINILNRIGTLHTFAGGPRRGVELSDTKPICPAAVAWDDTGRIVDVGPQDEIEKKYRYNDVIWHDAGGMMVTPGLIDSHTHCVHAGGRSEEFVLRCLGADYMKILESGGGILNSADRTREASQGELMETGRKALDLALSFGVTTIEVKSGYGLDTESELKMLRAIKDLGRTHEMRVYGTFCGAHAVPREFKDRPDRYVDLVVNEMIPRVAEEKLASYCDVFIEKGAFSVEQGRRILEAGLKYGLRPKVHCDEISSIGATRMCVELGALSVDHLIAITDESIGVLAKSNTVGCLLPGTSFFLKKSYAPCRKMIDAGCLLALATDNNPGSSRTENLQWILTTACLYYGLRPEEAFSMVTVNAAASMGLQNEVGSIEKGKWADLAIWDIDNLAEVPYHHAVNNVKGFFVGGASII